MDHDPSTLAIAWSLFVHVIVPIAVLYFIAACVVADEMIRERVAGERMRTALQR